MFPERGWAAKNMPGFAASICPPEPACFACQSAFLCGILKMDIQHWQEQSCQRRSTPILMETARYKLQGLYSLLAGLVLLVGVPFYQAIVHGPAGYRAPSDSAFNHADYAPLLGWVSNHGSAFTVFRILELLTFLLALRLPLALHRAFRSYGQTLARWMLVGGLGGLIIFAAMLALSTISFINAAASYSALAPTSAAAKDVVSSFSGLYGVEELAQNTLGGALLAIFSLCASLLFARSGKLQSLLVYFGLLVAALLAGLALLFAVSPKTARPNWQPRRWLRLPSG